MGWQPTRHSSPLDVCKCTRRSPGNRYQSDAVLCGFIARVRGEMTTVGWSVVWIEERPRAAWSARPFLLDYAAVVSIALLPTFVCRLLVLTRRLFHDLGVLNILRFPRLQLLPFGRLAGAKHTHLPLQFEQLLIGAAVVL